MATDTSSRTSPSLLGRLRTAPGDQEAWARFVARYAPQVYGWCRQWGLQEADAQDVTQDVLLALGRKMQAFTYDPSRSFRGWLRTLTRHAWCDFLAGARQVARGSGNSAELARLHSVQARDDLAGRLEEEFDRELLELALARVRDRAEPRTWEAFRLLALESWSGARAAEHLGMKVANVFVARSNVQKRVREELRRLGAALGEQP